MLLSQRHGINCYSYQIKLIHTQTLFGSDMRFTQKNPHFGIFSFIEIDHCLNSIVNVTEQIQQTYCCIIINNLMEKIDQLFGCMTFIILILIPFIVIIIGILLIHSSDLYCNRNNILSKFDSKIIPHQLSKHPMPSAFCAQHGKAVKYPSSL